MFICFFLFFLFLYTFITDFLLVLITISSIKKKFFLIFFLLLLLFFGCCFSSSLSLHTIVNAKRFYMNYSDVQTRYLLPIDTLVCHCVFFPWFSISCTELITCTGQLCQCQGGIYLPSKLFLMKISLMP